VTAPQSSEQPTGTGYEAAQEAVGAIAKRYASPPRVALVLGSGLGGLADRIADRAVIPYAEIPHMPRSTVIGHAGQLALGTIGGVRVAAMQGRFHLYEGYSPQQVVFPLRVLRLLGAETLLVTAAAGGLNPAFAAGALMLVRDHIGLPVLAGMNPLRGPNDERFGVRFPALIDAYDPQLRALAQEVARAQGITLHEGVYAMLSGPSFETPAELRLLRALGADAVGMSTVPEVIAARHMGMRTLAACVITNAALEEAGAGIGAQHDEVLAVAAAAGVSLGDVLAGVIAGL
jgi:purine-nucleoside phosphorylase